MKKHQDYDEKIRKKYLLFILQDIIIVSKQYNDKIYGS